jgi:hypothetical protein
MAKKRLKFEQKKSAPEGAAAQKPLKRQNFH